MSGGMNPLNGVNIVDKTTTKTQLADVISLTGLSTQSDAWGKPIPITFGRTRVPGVLVWASEFYKTTSGFDVNTQFVDKYYTNVFALPQNGGTGGPSGVSEYSQTTKETVTASNIDLCYSLGKDGDTRRKRYVDVIRINEIIVYDNKTGYIAPNLGFNVRYGYDNNVDPVMAKYDNGDLFYKDQTLLIFNRFPLADFDNSVPKTVDVEFGCLPGEVDIYPCLTNDCGYKVDLDRHVTREAGLDKIAAGEVKWSSCHIILLTCSFHVDVAGIGQGNNNFELDYDRQVNIITFGEGRVETVAKIVSEAEAREYNKNGVQLVTAFNRPGVNLINGRVRVIQISGDFITDTQIFQDPAEVTYNPRNWQGPGLVFRDAFVFATIDGDNPGVVTSDDPVISVPSAHIQMTSHASVVNADSVRPDGGVITCPGRRYFAVHSTRVRFVPCEGL